MPTHLETWKACYTFFFSFFSKSNFIPHATHVCGVVPTKERNIPHTKWI